MHSQVVATPTSDSVQASREQFNAHAEKYASSTVHSTGASLPVLAEFAAPQSDDVVLDVATGTGNAAFALARNVSQVIGLDVSPKMLEQARQGAEREGLTNVSFQEGPAEHLPFSEEAFTLVVSRHAPHHFRDVATFLREVHRVLKPGGRFVLADQITPRADLVEWVDFWQRQRDPSHFTQRTPEQWQELAQEAGFRVTQKRLVPYRLEFDWWTRQSGSSPETVEVLREHARGTNSETRDMLGLEFDEAGQVQAHREPMLVARFDR